MKYPYFRGLEADRYSFYRVPKALIKVDLFEKMSGDAKLLYAVLLDRMNLSLKNGWQDENGNAYIICTIDEIMDSIRCARQKAVKLLDELEHEYQLIERRRQGLGKPNLLYVKDLYAGLSESNYWKYENQTSGGLKSELPGVWKSNGSNTEKNNKTDNSEPDLIYSAELQEEERYRHYFKEKLELSIMEQNYPMDKAVLYEILELLVETVTSRKKFLRICGEEKPREVVKSRLMKLDSMHIQYVMECLKSNTTQVRNIKQYLLATLYNAPTTILVEKTVIVNHAASVLMAEELDLGAGGRLELGEEGLNFTGGLLTVREFMEEQEHKKDGLIHGDSDQIAVEGHVGTWYAIDETEVGGEKFFLLEHEEYGDEAACVAVNEQGKLVAEDLWNGFDENFQDAVKEYFAEKNPTSQKEEQVVPVEEESRTDDSDVPVYYESFGYAAENGEVDLYRISRQLNEECRNAIEEAIADNFDGIYSGMFDLMVGGEVQAEVVNHIQHYRESPLVQKAISDMKTLLEKRQASKELEERPNTRQSVREALKNRKKAQEQQPHQEQAKPKKAKKKGEMEL